VTDHDHDLEPRPYRFVQSVEVRLCAPDGAAPIATDSRTLNISANGLLMDVPAVLDGVAGQEVRVEVRWPGGEFSSLATIVRFESPYGVDPARQVMALQLHTSLPSSLLISSS
jgi:hypothetical protein